MRGVKVIKWLKVKIKNDIFFIYHFYFVYLQQKSNITPL